MTLQADENSATTAVRAGYEFDEGRLVRWLSETIEGYGGPLKITQFAGGQSNPTYKLSTPQRSYVLRKKPPGPVLKGAHAVEREARIMSALAAAHFPVPHIHGLCIDDTLIGTPFYVMDLVEGRVFWDATFPDITSDERPAYFDAMNETIAQLHMIDFQKLGLADFGRPGNYFERQIARWSKQYVEDPEAGRDPNMNYLLAWLPANIPAGDEASIVHGDFRCDNMIFHPTEARVVAVLDWELSTLGHPLADFAYHAMMYHMPPNLVAGLIGADLGALNIPREKDYIQAYCRRVGRASIPEYDFYLAFNFFRIAAIFHGIKGRVLRGTASSANAKERAEAFPVLAELGAKQARQAANKRPC